jgi:hypothetical protein
MKKFGTTCKFCKTPITLSIDDAYDAISDPQKIIPLACCNRCADLRVEKRKLESQIQHVCTLFRLSPKKYDSDTITKTKGALTRLTQDYAKMICRWNRMEGMAWEESVVEQLIEHPESWADVIGRLWKVFKATQETLAV